MFVEGAVRIRSDSAFCVGFCGIMYAGLGEEVDFFWVCAAGYRGHDVELRDTDSHGMLEYVACFSFCIDDKKCNRR